MNQQIVSLEPVFDRETKEWLIESETNPQASYRVSLTETRCSCPHWEHRLKDQARRECKHIRAAQAFEKREAERQAALKQAAKVLRRGELEAELRALFA